MGRPRLSIAVLMLAVMILAADCAVVRSALTTFRHSPSLPVFLIGAVPVADALTVGLLFLGSRLRRHGVVHPFLTGFVASGLAAMLLYALTFLVAPEAVMAAARELVRPAFDSLKRLGVPSDDRTPAGLVVGYLAEVGSILTVFSLPQLLGAAAGGWVARRLGIALVRRVPGLPGEGAGGEAPAPGVRETAGDPSEPLPPGGCEEPGGLRGASRSGVSTSRQGARPGP
jgi:hypothetical protein